MEKNQVQEAKTMMADRRLKLAASSLLRLLEELITQILLLANENMPPWYLQLRKVCTTFQRICDAPDVLHRLSLCKLRDYCYQTYEAEGLFFEARFLHYGHPEAVCYDGMNRLVMQPWHPTFGLALLKQTAEAGDSCAAYFTVMVRYRCNPSDPRALALIQGICSGPSLPDDRWENTGLELLRHCVHKDLSIIAWRNRIYARNDAPDLIPQDPHVCIWEKCRRFREGDSSRTILYCSVECRFSHEFELWTWHLTDRVTTYNISRINV